jgi:hypothetical protein
LLPDDPLQPGFHPVPDKTVQCAARDDSHQSSVRCSHHGSKRNLDSLTDST